MGKKLAVFDWNGTLFDDAKSNFKAANECLKAFGRDPITIEHYRDTFDFPIIHFYERNGVNANDFLTDVDKSCDLFINTYEKNALKAPLRGGVVDLLEWLKDNNFEIIILSNHLSHLIQKQLERFEIWYYFDHVSGNTDQESVISKMNKEQRMMDFLAKSKIDASDSFIIGDSFEEPHIAQHIGMKSISITGGCISKERLLKAKADAMIDSLDEVPDILKGFWGI